LIVPAVASPTRRAVEIPPVNPTLAVDDVDHTGREQGGHLLQQQGERGRGERGRLEHQRVAGRQGGRQLHHRQDDRHVPRDDRGGDTARHAFDTDEALLVVVGDWPAEVLHQAGRVLQDSCAEREVCLRLPQHAAVLADQQRCQVPGGPADYLRGGEQLAGPPGRRGVAPAGECLVGGDNSAVHVVGGAGGDAGDDIVEASWVVGVPNVAIGDHLPADEMANVGGAGGQGVVPSLSPGAVDVAPAPGWRRNAFVLSGIPDGRLQSCTAVTGCSAVIM
jgi:hypothetical protein